MSSNRTRTIVEIGLSIALAAVLNTFKLGQMPQGGTISLVMLPIIIVAIRRGPIAGVIAGVLYGCLDLMFDPYVVHPIQLLLDYPLAYGAVGLAGLFASSWRQAVARDRILMAIWTVVLPATALAAAARYVMHVGSGVVFFAEYAPAGTPVLLYSALYNLFVPVSALACFAAAAVVLPAIARSGVDVRLSSETSPS